MTDPSGPLERVDVDNFYRLFLARPAEARAAEVHRGASAVLMGGRCLNSPEFRDHIEEPLLAGAPVSVDPTVRRGVGDLAAWAAQVVIGEPANREAARASSGWHALLAAVLSDGAFRSGVAAVAPAERLDRLAAALRRQAEDRARVDLAGVIESCDAHGAAGWAVNLVLPDEPLTLEVFADGAFVGAAKTGAVRRDIQEIYRGEGRFGFSARFEIAPTPDGRAIEVEIREAISGQSLGRRILPGDAQPSLDGWRAVQRELAEVKAALARIERLVPDLRSAASFSPASYADYWDRLYAFPEEAAPAEGPMFSIVCLAEDDLGALARRLASVRAQTYRRWTLSALVREDVASEERRALFEKAGEGGEAMALRVFPTGTPLTAMRNAAASEAEGDFIVFLAGGALASDALATMARAVNANGDVAMLFADGDSIRREGDRESHVSPRFLGGFDAELLAQTAYLGDFVALRAGLFGELGGFRADFETVQDHDLWLRVSEAAAGRILHLPRVLQHRLDEPAPPLDAALVERETARSVADQFQRLGCKAAAEPRRDILGAATPGAARARPGGLGGIRARIIIPTRDRFDLLEKCLASLERSRAANEVAFEVVVIDNASDPLTGPPALAALAERWGFATQAFAGAFNWAAINNQGARGADAEALIFLNNDTMVVSPGWCDALVGLAVRADVGAAGARLLYEDGTIQHAGMVIAYDGQPMHEGAGTSGADGGYLGRHALAHQCVSVTGACMATRSDLFASLGGFDETFAVTLNDVDYCARVRAAGLKVIYTPDATLYHLEAKSRGYDAGPDKAARAELERQAFRAKWGEAASADPFYNPHFERFAPPFSRLAPPPRA